MMIDGLREWLDATPFKPFVMRLMNGHDIKVKHPEVVARSPSGKTFVVFTNGDRFEMVDLLHVASIQHAHGKRNPSNGNGRRDKSK